MTVRDVLAAAALCGAAAGCGGDTGEVAGAVRLDGKPVPIGKVTFLGTGGRVESAWLAADGSYRVPHAPVGPARVAVQTPDARLAAQATGPPPVYSDDPEAKRRAEELYRRYKDGRLVTVPRKYADPETSGLTADVRPGSQTHDIDLAP